MIYFKKFGMYANQKVDDFIKEKIEEWDFVMVSIEMNNIHFRFGGDFEMFLMSIIYKRQIVVLKMIQRI